jgi:hypothetical protein
MKKFIYIFYLLPLFLVYSCEQPSEEADIPYVPKLVIRGIISNGNSVKDIYVGRTMPVSVKIESSFTDLTDASVAIVWNDLIYPLTHTKNGLYKNDTLQIRRGEKYTLLASWQNLSINAETTVPFPGNISSFALQTQSSDTGKVYFLQGRVFPIADEVYCAAWASLNLDGTIADESKIFSTVVGKNPTGIVNCTTANIPPNFINQSLRKVGAHVFIYDHAFLDFYNTQNLNQVSDAIFGQTGSQIKWNIKGTGIGMFVARIDTLISK